MTTPTEQSPQMSGSNDLQGSINALDRDIKTLTGAIQGINNGNGTVTSSAMSQTFASQGVTFTNGSQNGTTAYGAGLGSFGGGGGGLFGGGSGGGSGGSSGTNPYSFGQAVANAATSVVNGQFLLGAQQLNDQATINTYGYTQAGFWNTSSQSTIKTAFGGGAGAGMTTNNMAYSAADARAGASILSQISGQANYTAPAGAVYGRGNSPFQAAAGIAMANPGLGMAQSASTSGAWYNAGTSYNLMMMGISTTPLQLGTGKAQNMNSVEAAIGQRFGFQGYNAKTGTFNSQNLAANLNNPLFQMQIMQATGMTQDQYNQWAQSWAQENTWASKSGTTMNQMQNEISQYMNGSTQAQQGAASKWLQSHGVSMSLLQSMTQAQAGQTATEAGGNAAFTKGLQLATGAVNKFTQALSAGIQAMAGTAGFAGAIGSLNSSGVSGAGAGGVSNTIIAGIASAASSLTHDLSTFSADLSAYQNANGGSSSSQSGGSGYVNSSSGGTFTDPGGTVTINGNSVTVRPKGFVGPVATTGGGTATANRALGQRMASLYGWGSGGQWNALNQLMMNESGWITDNQNPGSTAFGIGQFLNSTWGIYDHITKSEARGNPALQIQAMLDYVKGRWGSPANAMKNYYNQFGPGIAGYDSGTSSAKPGLALVGERGPELVSLSGGQKIVSASKTAQMLQPMFTGSSMGSTAGLTIKFEKGSINFNSTGSTAGYHTSADVQTLAAQITQAVETSLSKSMTLKNIAAGMTNA